MTDDEKAFHEDWSEFFVNFCGNLVENPQPAEHRRCTFCDDDVTHNHPENNLCFRCGFLWAQCDGTIPIPSDWPFVAHTYDPYYQICTEGRVVYRRVIETMAWKVYHTIGQFIKNHKVLLIQDPLKGPIFLVAHLDTPTDIDPRLWVHAAHPTPFTDVVCDTEEETQPLEAPSFTEEQYDALFV